MFDEANTSLNIGLSRSAFSSADVGLHIAKVIRSSKALGSVTVKNKCPPHNFSNMLRGFIPSLASLKSLHTLVLSDSSMETDVVISLSKVLTALTGLHTLDISVHGYGDIDAASESIATSLMGLSRLRSLDLSGNNIGLNYAASLALSLIALTGLNTLKLCNNGIGPEGAASLAPSLMVLTGLHTLDLGMNSLGPVGASLLASSLECLTGLQDLDLSFNRFGPAGAASLAPSLKLLTGLHSFQLITLDRLVQLHWHLL